LTFRQLCENEIQKIGQIDRSEVITSVYYLENNQLVLKPEFYDMQGWPPGEIEGHIPRMVDCYARGGWFQGAFEGNILAGIAILESRFIGSEKDTLQLDFLHVSCPYRGAGLGKALFIQAAQEARQRGATRMYISATPSEHTVQFYLRRGCQLASEINPELFAPEPKDIHLEYNLS
jgi:GNAT superfamily N-acetyltransferase